LQDPDSLLALAEATAEIGDESLTLFILEEYPWVLYIFSLGPILPEKTRMIGIGKNLQFLIIMDEL
jgi:hypothetical protein